MLLTDMDATKVGGGGLNYHKIRASDIKNV